MTGPLLFPASVDAQDNLALIGKIEEAYTVPGGRERVKPLAEKLIADGPASAQDIISALEGGTLSPASQTTLCYILGIIEVPEAAPRLISLLARKDISPAARIRLVRLLGEWDYPAAVPEMLRIAEDPEEDRNLRIVSIGIFGKRSDPAALTVLMNVARNKNSESFVRYKAVQMLENYPAREADQTLLQLLEKPDPGGELLIQRAIISLGNKKSGPAFAVLAQLAGDRSYSPIVRRRALLSLGKIDDRKALEVLEELSGDENLMVSSAARKARAFIAGVESGPDPSPPAGWQTGGGEKLFIGPEKKTE